MKSFKLMLRSIDEVKTFVEAASSFPCEIDVVSGRYIIDAKSIMGLFSLDLAKPIQADIHGSDSEIVRFEELIKQYIV